MTTKIKPVVAKPALRTMSKLSPADKVQAELLWSSGDHSAKEISEKLSVTQTSLTEYMKKNGIKRGSIIEAKRAEAKKTIEENTKSEMEVLAARAKETKEEHYKMSASIAKLAMAEVLKAKQASLPYSSIKDNLKALESAMNVIQKSRIERWAVLGLDKEDPEDDELPELVISELTAEQIQKMRDKEEVELGVEEIAEELGIDMDDSLNIDFQRNDDTEEDDDDENEVIEEA